MTKEKQPLYDITKYLRPYIEQIDNHPLYKKIRTLHNLLPQGMFLNLDVINNLLIHIGNYIGMIVNGKLI